MQTRPAERQVEQFRKKTHPKTTSPSGDAKCDTCFLAGVNSTSEDQP
jgi:hypothetical protein